MKIYDISQEVFGCAVYPGDPSPKKETLASMGDGDLYNLTAFSMCAHNGTHIDAPSHFIENGDSVEKIPLSKFIGHAYVAECSGVVDANCVKEIVRKAKDALKGSEKRILVKGKAELSLEGASALITEGVYLYGNESQTVGPENAPMAVHKLLLGEKTVLLEGIRLSDVPEGVYLLFSAPLLLKGTEGSPCRAVLVEL